MVVIVDYGMGNVGSIKNMLLKIGHEGRLSSDPDIVHQANKLILPGVGSFDRGMEQLKNGDLRNALDEAILNRKTPVLGICLGMQLMTRNSEEGIQKGLGWIDAHVKKFSFPPSPAGQKTIRIPHMGWNSVQSRGNSRLFEGWDGPARFYFVHSYYVVCDESETTSLTAHHGIEFTAGFEKGHIFGVQFHPEKSHKFGMRLLKRFMEL